MLKGRLQSAGTQNREEAGKPPLYYFKDGGKTNERQRKKDTFSEVLGRGLAASLVIAALVALTPGPVGGQFLKDFKHFNQPGNILISDQFNNRVIEIDKEGVILWQFGLGPDDTSATSPLGVNDAQRVGTFTLVAGTGVPPGLEPGCPAGCPDNRVMLVSDLGNIVWQYGQFGVTGSDFNQLNTPVQCTWLPTGTVLITDQGNQRIIEVDMQKNILWQYGETGMAGNGPNQLNSPNSAELLANGHILIADEANDRVIEVTRDLAIVDTFTAGGTVSGAAFASRLPDGNTLITDANNNRIVEVDPDDTIVWEYFTNLQPGSNPMPLPTRAIRLRNGDTIISDQFNHRVIIINRSSKITAQYGNLNLASYGAMNTQQGLNAPYDAKVINDYTGLTPPFGFTGRQDRD